MDCHSSSPDVVPVRDVDAAPASTSYNDHGFFHGWSEAKRYTVHELIGKGSYGTVCAATDNMTGEKVAIKKIQNVFDNVADATRILREIKLLRLLKHADVVEIKHICLPSDPRSFKDIYVVFELMESDLHTVIGANDDLTCDHHKVFLYQLLRGLNYVHQAGVLHRDLKPKNILANSNCKLKICDFGLARPFLSETSETSVFWTDYVATRWYRAPELCGCFYGRYSQAVDIWSIGCIFAEILLGKPLFPGRDAVMQLTLITDLLGKPTQSVIDRISNQKARAFLQALPPKPPRAFESKFPNADLTALDLLRRLLSFDPMDRPTASDALQHPYFSGLPNAAGLQDVPFMAREFDFELHKLTEAEVRALIYAEVLHYHPTVAAHLSKGQQRSLMTSNEDLRRQFMALEAQQQQIAQQQQKQQQQQQAAAVAATYMPQAGYQQQQQQATAAAQYQQQQQQAAAAARAQQAQQHLHHPGTVAAAYSQHDMTAQHVQQAATSSQQPPAAPWKAQPAGGMPYHQRSDTVPLHEQLQHQYEAAAVAAVAANEMYRQQQAAAAGLVAGNGMPGASLSHLQQAALMSQLQQQQAALMNAQGGAVAAAMAAQQRGAYGAAPAPAGAPSNLAVWGSHSQPTAPFAV